MSPVFHPNPSKRIREAELYECQNLKNIYSLILKVFVDGNFECKYYTIIRFNQKRLRENATIGPQESNRFRRLCPPPPTGKSEFPPLIPGQYNSRSFHLQISSTISSIDRDAPNPDI
jgi:hypothetical protein